MPNWPGNDSVFALAEPLIQQFEGLKLSPYLDSAGIPTIGYGTISYANEQRVTMSDPTITQDYAEQCLTYQMTLKCSRRRGRGRCVPDVG